MGFTMWPALLICLNHSITLLPPEQNNVNFSVSLQGPSHLCHLPFSPKNITIFLLLGAPLALHTPTPLSLMELSGYFSTFNRFLQERWLRFSVVMVRIWAILLKGLCTEVLVPSTVVFRPEDLRKFEGSGFISGWACPCSLPVSDSWLWCVHHCTLFCRAILPHYRPKAAEQRAETLETTRRDRSSSFKIALHLKIHLRMRLRNHFLKANKAPLLDAFSRYLHMQWHLEPSR